MCTSRNMASGSLECEEGLDDTSGPVMPEGSPSKLAPCSPGCNIPLTFVLLELGFQLELVSALLGPTEHK